MRATVGRIVLFTPPKAEGGAAAYAAIVTAERADVTGPEGGQGVDLWTFGPGSLYFHAGVTYADPPREDLGTWRWPPRV